jgi:UDP-glucose 4-epimerase
LGTTVCSKLMEEGFEVRVFDLDTPRNRKSIKEIHGKADVIWGDITQPDSVRQALQDMDAVVHMAGILPPVANERPELADKVNVGGTRVLVDLLKAEGQHIPFVFTSSVAVFGPTPQADRPLSPDMDTPCPNETYGQTKLQAENVIRESGIDYVILRLSATLYSAFSVRDVKRLFSIPLHNRVEFCHPDDTAVAIVNAIKSFDVVKGNTLVIGGGPDQQMLYKDMTGAMFGVMGLPLPPAGKFPQEPSYLDWYDTSRSQQLLRFQRKTFADYLEGYSRELSKRYSVLFLPFMCYFVGPLFGKLVARLM